MRRKNLQKAKQKVVQQLPSWLLRYSNTLIVALLWPVLFLANLYLILFFFLNSSAAPTVLHAQLGNFLRGDYFVDRMMTDPYLRTLTLINVRLSEAGRQEAIIFAPRVEAKIPLLELVDLITASTLRIGKITAYNPTVILDFTQGELNLLKVVLPYPVPPKPPPETPSDFAVFLSNLNVQNGVVHLLFEGFDIELNGVDVHDFSIRAGSILQMSTPRRATRDNPPIKIVAGRVTFNPATFGFPLSDIGDASEGLVLSGGSGTAGKMAYAYGQMSRHLEAILRQDQAMAPKLGLAPLTRGNFIVPLYDARIEGFFWMDQRFDIPHMTASIGDAGRLLLQNAYMNVGPTQADIDAASSLHHHKPSGLLPQESILWGADLDLKLGATDTILAYFFGPILHGRGQFDLQAQMAGDLARVSGNLGLLAHDFETFGMGISRTSLNASMDGQKLTIDAFEASTDLGSLLLAGQYFIMDGNFDLNLWAGTVPDSGFDDMHEDFRAELRRGMAPLEFLPDGAIKRFSGTFSSHLRATSKDGEIAVSLGKPLTWMFDEAVAGIRQITIRPDAIRDNRILTLRNNILRSPGGLNIALGRDRVSLRPGMRLNLDDLWDVAAQLNLNIESPAAYAALFGFTGLRSAPLNASLAFSTQGRHLSGHLIFRTHDVQYSDIAIRDININMVLDNGRLRTQHFGINTDFGRLLANITGNIHRDNLTRPTRIPLEARITLHEVDLSKIKHHTLESLGLKGMSEGEINYTGTIENPRVQLTYDIHDFQITDIPFSRIRIRAGYERGKVSLPLFAVWLDPVPEGQRRAPDFSINTLTYDIQRKHILFNTVLRPLSPNRFDIFRDLGFDFDAKIAFDLSANIDLGALLGSRKKLQTTWIEGEFNLRDVHYAGLSLGDSQILFSRSQQYTLLKGFLFDALTVSGYGYVTPELSASVSIDFPDLDILQRLNDIGLDIGVHRQRFGLNSARTSGSIGFCVRGLGDVTLSLILDSFESMLLGDILAFTQPAVIRVDLTKRSVDIQQIEMRFRDSVLKISGQADAAGHIDVDVNGEIDAAIARSFSSLIKDASGLLGISLSARGNFLDKHGALHTEGVDITGYLGVRNPIQVLTEYTTIPIELRRGFFVINDAAAQCSYRETCLYTPNDQPFELGINDHWVRLSFFASPKGLFDINMHGNIQATLAQQFIKDITAAQGSLDLDLSLSGNFLDKHGALNLDPKSFHIGGYLGVDEPIRLELRALNDTIEIDRGSLLLTEGENCSGGTTCLTIPKDRAFTGAIMGGNFIIFGEIQHEGILLQAGNLSVTANNVSFRMQDELALTLSPDIQISIRDFSDFETYRIAGNIDIAEARYRRNFDDTGSNFIRDQILSHLIDSRRRVDTYSPPFLRRMPQLGRINLDLDVTAENALNVDVRIAGATVNLELGTQLRIGGTVRDIQPRGILAFNHGTLKFRDNEFDFQPGAQIAFNGSLDGRIDISATTEINTASNALSAVLGRSDLDRRRRITTTDAPSSLYAITLNVAGTVFRPSWSFDSSPFLTDTNIYALIITGRTIEDFSGNEIAMESLLSPFFSSQLDTFLDADQFKFLFSEGAAQFVYVKQINKGLRIAAGVSIRGSEGNEQALSAEYYFNDNWFIDLTGQNTADEPGRAPTFKLGARLHWHLPIE